MFSVFSEHQSFITSRRALLISSALTIIIASASVSGNGITMFGLTLHFSKDNALILARLSSAYLLFTFLVIALSELISTWVDRGKISIETLKKKSLDHANNIDTEMRLNDQGQEPDRDPWWERHRDNVDRYTRTAERMERFRVGMFVLRRLLVDLCPPVLMGVAATFFPDEVAIRFLSFLE